MVQISEIKARCRNAASIREYLISRGAICKGTDLQTDTYFSVAKGRLKLRQGNIENSLIYYERENIAGAKKSTVQLMRLLENSDQLKAVLSDSHKIMVVVRKKREIYFIENVKFHIDEVEGLGSFVEIEAIDADGTLGYDMVRKQCNDYIHLLGIREEDLLTHSYSDLLLGES